MAKKLKQILNMIPDQGTRDAIRFICDEFLNNDLAIVIGKNGSGTDVRFYSATSGKYFLWDESADTLNVHGLQKFHAHLVTESYGAQFRTEYNAATGDFFGIDAEAHQQVSRTAGGVRGLSMTARVVASTTVSGSANIVGGHFLLDNDGTLNGTGLHAALVAKVDAGGTFTAVGHLASLWVDSLQAGTVTGNHELIYATNNGASVMDNFLYLYAGNKITSFMKIDTATGMVSANTVGDATFANWKTIKIDLDGTVHYLIAAQAITG